MSAVALSALVHACDRLLRPGDFQDWEGAWNGLQVENRGQVRRIAAAVDASLTTVRLAIAEGANLLLVHHGLFWSKRLPWTGGHYQLLRLLLDHDVAVYSSHLPLDAHPRLGNNMLLARALGLGRTRPFFFDRGTHLGRQATVTITRADLAARLETATGHKPLVIPGGPARCRRVGIVTGGAGADLQRAVDEGVDTFVTGEGPHWTFALAEERGLNVLYGGHYGTETFGVKALAAHLSRQFQIPWRFLDHPTGL